MFSAHKFILAISFFVVHSTLPLAHAQTASSGVSSTTSSKIMSLSSVREGMKGTAKTVFNGSEPEEFNVEIIGVVPGGIGPKQDLIVGRISGGKADRTGVFAGMSGSPVYVDGKLIGAISYSFPFSKEPMCGITPIEQMLSIFEQRNISNSVSEPRMFSFAELASTDWAPAPRRRPLSADPVVMPGSAGSMLSSVAGQAFRPIGTPVTFNGVSQEVLDMFAPELVRAGLVPIAAAGGSSVIGPMKAADENTLVGGDSVSMQLTRGDMSMAASGTVTLRDGDRIYAFGHPFLSLGSSDLPMAESSVVTVVPNVNNSFKLAVPHSMVGTMTQDRATGVYGKLGQEPRLIPVSVTLETSRGVHETLKFEVVKDSLLTPLLLNIGIVNFLLAQERGLGDSMVAVSGQMKVKNAASITIERRFAGSQANAMAAGSIAAPIAIMFRSGFDEFDVEKIDIQLRSADTTRTATLERVSVDRKVARPGSTINVLATAMTNTGKQVMQSIPIKIPESTPAGTYSIVIGDGASLQRTSSVQQFVPRTLTELVQTINKVKLSDRLYAQLVRTSSGAIVGANEMPGLPPSILATLNNDRSTGGVKPAVSTIVSELTLDLSEYIISGDQKIDIVIEN